MLCELRIASEAFDVDSFLALRRDLDPDAVWHKGERRGRSTRPTSGLNLFVCEEAEWEPLLRRAMEKLRVLRPLLESARKAGAAFELDFGVEAGETGAFTIGARIGPSDLAELSEAGVVLCVTVYPPSCDVEAANRREMRDGRRKR